MSYSAADIIGKSLIAKRPIPVYSNTSAGAKPLLVIPPGGTVGVVYSYIVPKPGNPYMYWQFESPVTKRMYYAKHVVGSFDERSLKDQGVKTAEERTKAEEEKTETTYDKVKKLVMVGIGVTAAVALGKEFIKSKLSSK